MAKTVLFIPGFQEDAHSRDYAAVLTAIEEKGYVARLVGVHWNYRTLDDWVRQVEKEYAQLDSDQTILAGFSFGAMTALAVAARRTPAQLWLCSLSPYFAEDLPGIRPAWLAYIGKRRAAVFSKLLFAELAQKIKCKTIIFIGSNEIRKFSDMEHRSKEAQRLISGSSFHIVRDAGHEVDAPAYIAALRKSIRAS